MGRSSAGGGGSGSSGGSRGGGSSGGHRVSGSSRSSRSSGSPSFGGSHNSYSDGHSRNNSSSYGHGNNSNRVFITNNNFGHIPRRRAYGYSGLISAVTIIILVLVFVLAAKGSEGSIPVSTANREALSKENVDKTDWFTDDLDWIKNKSKLQAGMKHFYETTGVQPYLWITDNINGDRWPEDSVIDAELKSMYEEIFTDGQHFLLMYLDAGNGKYITRYYCGPQAKVLMDNEASEILLSYIDHYTTSDMDDESLFSTSFQKTADRIMTVTTNKFDVAKVVIILVIVVVVIIGAVIVIKLLKSNMEKRKEVLQQTQEILDTPLTSSLEEKYKDKM